MIDPAWKWPDRAWRDSGGISHEAICEPRPVTLTTQARYRCLQMTTTPFGSPITAGRVLIPGL